MADPSPQVLINLLLEQYGTTFAQELHIPLEQNSPAALFRLLCAAQLFSARIQTKLAIQAAKALTEQGWTTPQSLLAADWATRVHCLNQAGYARYDERTATMLGVAAQWLLDRYDGDLRHLREAANREPQREHHLLQEFKGIGNVGANIFLREVQVVWEEVFPFADDRTLATAQALRLPAAASGLREWVADRDFARLIAALVRVRLAHEEETVWEQARAIATDSTHAL